MSWFIAPEVTLGDVPSAVFKSNLAQALLGYYPTSNIMTLINRE